MATINVNTSLLKDCGEEVQKLVNEYQNLVVDFYTRIQKIPDNMEWIGTNSGAAGANSVHRFVKKATEEIPNYEDFGKSINRCGVEMVDYAFQLEKIIEQNRLS